MEYAHLLQQGPRSKRVVLTGGPDIELSSVESLCKTMLTRLFKGVISSFMFICSTFPLDFCWTWMLMQERSSSYSKEGLGTILRRKAEELREGWAEVEGVLSNTEQYANNVSS